MVLLVACGVLREGGQGESAYGDTYPARVVAVRCVEGLKGILCRFGLHKDANGAPNGLRACPLRKEVPAGHIPMPTRQWSSGAEGGAGNTFENASSAHARIL